jgi:hypothetical protein
MNTVEVGDLLEARVFELLQSEIDAGRFIATRECCRVFRKKGYHSKDRETNIVFDLSVEISLPGAEAFSVLVVVECKNYSSSVGVGDIEEFESKLRQVNASKGILVSTAEFQSGAIAFARSKRIGLARYFHERNFKWHLHRSVAMFGVDPLLLSPEQVYAGLVSPSYRSNCHAIHFALDETLGTSIVGLFERICMEAFGDPTTLAVLWPPRPPDPWRVDFVPSEQIEQLAQSVLTAIGYEAGEVSLEAICERESLLSALEVRRVPPTSENGWLPGVLGRLQFEPLRITLFTDVDVEPYRQRFTLAHELGHHFLGHSTYMREEYSEAPDYELDAGLRSGGDNIRRMEWQANHFASCMLLPAAQLLQDFLAVARRYELKDKGHGLLYVDEQPCNQIPYYDITNRLMAKYKASRSAIKFRLERLGVLNDARRKTERLTLV